MYMKYIIDYNQYIINEAAAMTKADFLSIAKAKWDDLYKYNHANFQGMNTPIRIECKKHGPFNITPLEHIKGKGCPECSGSKGFDRTVNQQGYLPDTVPEPDLGNLDEEDIRKLKGNEMKDRETKPFYGNRQQPGRKLTHHRVGGGRGKG